MYVCHITFNNQEAKTCDFQDLEPEQFDKVIGVAFPKLCSAELEIHTPNVYNLINLEKLETADSIRITPQYSNKLGNLIHLNTIKKNSYAMHRHIISKYYQFEKSALITNYNPKMIISADILYLNIFVGHIIKQVISEYPIIQLLNNLHLGLKYLQINIYETDIFEFITNLPITLEIFNINIENSKNIEDNDLLLNKIKLPFNCKINLKFIN